VVANLDGASSKGQQTQKPRPHGEGTLARLYRCLPRRQGLAQESKPTQPLDQQIDVRDAMGIGGRQDQPSRMQAGVLPLTVKISRHLGMVGVR